MFLTTYGTLTEGGRKMRQERAVEKLQIYMSTKELDDYDELIKQINKKCFFHVARSSLGRYLISEAVEQGAKRVHKGMI